MSNKSEVLQPWEALANAIVIQAAKDYKAAYRKLNNSRKKNSEAERMKNECLRFFRSKWFTELTKVDGEYLIRRLNKEAG